MRRNSVNVEDGILPPEGIVRRHKPEKLFLRSSSVGLAPGDGELSPSPGPSVKSPDDKKQNRRESIKGHLMKFKAKAGKILEEKQPKLTVQEEQNSLSFVSQTESELREELSVVDESEPSIQESRKETKEQLRNRIRKSAQKAVERTRGNVQLSRRLARRPTVVMEEHLDENDLNAIDEQVERTIKMGEKYLVANDDTKKHQKDLDSFFEDVPKPEEEQKPPAKIIFGRIKGAELQNDKLVKYVRPTKLGERFGESFAPEMLKNALRPPTRMEYSDDSVSIFIAPEPVEQNSSSREDGRKYVQLDVFIDSIHFDHHYLWGEEEVAAAEFRNEHLSQTLRMYETKLMVINPEKKPSEIEKLVELKEAVRKGRLEMERLADILKETRRSQGYTATRVDYTAADQPWDAEDWSSCGKTTQSATQTPMGKIPKEARQRISALSKTEIQLVLYFNDMEVAKTRWILLSSDLMAVVRRFELEFFSPLKSLTLMVMEKVNKTIRVLGKGNVPLPNDEDDDVALMEVEFENDSFMAGKFGSLGSNADRKEGGRILCRTILEDGELRLGEERQQIETEHERKNKPFELIPSHLVLGSLHEDENKKRLEELREEDKAQKRFAYRSAIDSRRISALQFANLARKKVMDRRQRREKKYEEIVREVSIPTLSVAFSQLFGPADVSRKLKPMRKEERHREEGWDNTVVVNIQSATNLPVRHTGQLQPFVLVTFGGKRVSTDVAVGRHPNWQFTGKLVISKEEREGEFIEIRVYDQLVEEIDKDDRLMNVVHEQLSARLLASQRIRFETLASCSKINAPIHLKTPIHISGYHISPDASFLKVLLSTQIDPKLQIEYTRSPSSMETPKTLEKCANSERQFHQMCPQRTFRPLVTDLNAHSTVCTRYLRPINPPPSVMQESDPEKIVRMAARIVAGIPRVDATSHSDIWANAFQLTSIAAGGLEERATLLACWLLHFKLPVAIVLGEARGEKTGFVLTELATKQVLVDPDDGHIYSILDSNCGLEKIYGAFDVKNYYGNIQQYEQAHQIYFNLSKFTHWKSLFAPGEELLETVQPAMIQYQKVSEDWMVELRIALEREIKLRFDECRKHAIPQWHLVAARQLREALEQAPRCQNFSSSVEEKIARLKDGYGITVVVMCMRYSSMSDCVHQVLSARLQDSPEQNVQFALAVHVFDFFAHVIEVDVAVAILKPRK